MRKLFKRILCSMLSVALGVMSVPVIAPAAAAEAAITDLKVDNLREPLGVDDIPTFSWIIQSSGFGGAQSAYQIYVSTEARKAADGIGDVWDSGKISSNVNYGISYG